MNKLESGINTCLLTKVDPKQVRFRQVSLHQNISLFDRICTTDCGRRCYGCMVVVFLSTYAVVFFYCTRCQFYSDIVNDLMLSCKNCGRSQFCPGTPVFTINKTDRNVITENHVNHKGNWSNESSEQIILFMQKSYWAPKYQIKYSITT